MSTEKYAIAIRSYDRSESIKTHTYKSLAEQDGIDLSELLYIFVANEEEAEKYKESLRGLPYREIVIGKYGVGGSNAMRSISEYLPKNLWVLFLDDDLGAFGEYTSAPETYEAAKKYKIEPAPNLAIYIEDAIDTMRKFNLFACDFGRGLNYFYLPGHCWKEIRPDFLVGGCSLMRNIPKIVKTKYAHDDDAERTANVLEECGAILRYNWAGFSLGSWGSTPGGMQSSGDRGNESERSRYTRRICYEMRETIPHFKKYFSSIIYSKDAELWAANMKTFPQLQKISPTHISFPKYFSKQYIDLSL